jgi:hypothetical protein
MFCKQCKAVITRNARFCQNCGVAIVSDGNTQYINSPLDEPFLSHKKKNNISKSYFSKNSGKKILKKIVTIVVSISLLILFTFFSVIGEEFGRIFAQQSENNAKNEKLMKGLGLGAKQINDAGPTLVDKDTRIDGASVGPGVRLTYHYTLLNYMVNDSTPDFIKSSLFPMVTESVCSSSGLKQPLQLGVEIVYSYSDSNGISVGDLIIDRNDCGLSAI